MRTRLNFTLLAVVSFFFAAPAGAASNPSQVVTVGAGQEFDLTLASNQASGCQWQVASVNENVLQTLGKKYVEMPKVTLPPSPSVNGLSPGVPGMTGISGEELWTFRAVHKGTSDVVFDYKCGANAKTVQKEVYHVVVP
jgi:predicted secreted protein